MTDMYGPGGPYPSLTSREAGVPRGPLRNHDDDLWDEADDVPEPENPDEEPEWWTPRRKRSE